MVTVGRRLFQGAPQQRHRAREFAATEGLAPGPWPVAGGTLPAGLALNPTTGAITGTPTAAGPASFTVKVTDSTTPQPTSDSHAFGVIVQPAIVPGVYVVNGGYSGVVSYPLGTGGNLTPRGQITVGSATR